MTSGALVMQRKLKVGYGVLMDLEFLYMNSAYSVLNLPSLSVRVHGETGTLKASYGI